MKKRPPRPVSQVPVAPELPSPRTPGPADARGTEPAVGPPAQRGPSGSRGPKSAATTGVPSDIAATKAAPKKTAQQKSAQQKNASTKAAATAATATTAKKAATTKKPATAATAKKAATKRHPAITPPAKKRVPQQGATKPGATRQGAAKQAPARKPPATKSAAKPATKSAAKPAATPGVPRQKGSQRPPTAPSTARRPQATAAATAAGTTPAAQDRRRRTRRLLAVLAAVTVLVVAVTGALLLNRDDEPTSTATGGSQTPTASPTTGSGTDAGPAGVQPPAALAGPGSLVRSRITPDGRILVTTWIRSRTALTGINVAVPVLPGVSGMAARDMDVRADGQRVEGPDTVGTSLQPYSFDSPARVVRLRYALDGAVDLSSSVKGRGLARITALDVRWAPDVGPTTHTIVGGVVRSSACTGTSSDFDQPRPCGSPEGTGWSVELRGVHRGDRVQAQVDLG